MKRIGRTPSLGMGSAAVTSQTLTLPRRPYPLGPRRAVPLGAHHLLERRRDRPGDVPAGEMAAQLPEIGDVADVVAAPRLVAIAPAHGGPDQRADLLDRLEHRHTVLAPAAKVVDLARARLLGECAEGPHDVVAVDVVADLLPLVAEDRVVLPAHGALHQVRQEAVQLDAAVLRPGEAAAAEDA